MFDNFFSGTITTLLYISLGALLLLANVWYVKSLIGVARPHEADLIIAPFQIVGQEDPEQKIGAALANMLQARLSRLDREMKTSIKALKEANQLTRAEADLGVVKPAALDLGGFQPSVSPLESGGLAEVFVPMNVDIQVGGFELGGLVAQIQRHLVRNRLLHITVNYTGEKALVTGFLDQNRNKPVWVETSTDSEKVVDAVAYSMMKEAFAGSSPEIEAFTLEEFSRLIELLQEIATLNYQVSVGRSSRGDFVELLPQIEALANLHGRWGTLKRIAAEVAENAGEPREAAKLYEDALAVAVAKLQRLQSDVSRKTGSAKEVAQALAEETQSRIEDLRRRIARLTPASSTKAFTVDGDPASQKRRILELLGIDSVAMRSRPAVAILGGLPSTSLLDRETIRVIPGPRSEASSGQMDGMTTYFDAMVQAVQLVAPQAEILVTPSDLSRTQDFRSAADRLLAADPAVLLVPLTSDSEAFLGLLEHLAGQDVPVVQSAGTRLSDSQFESRYDDLTDRLIIVAPAGLDGRAASFAETRSGYFWAPGENVPVTAGRQREMSGSGPASALATGLVARLLDEHPGLGKDRIHEVLRGTSRAWSGGDVPLLGLGTALDALEDDEPLS